MDWHDLKVIALYAGLISFSALVLWAIEPVRIIKEACHKNPTNVFLLIIVMMAAWGSVGVSLGLLEGEKQPHPQAVQVPEKAATKVIRALL